MHFGFTKEQEDIRKAAASFAEGEFDPDRAAEWDKAYQFPLDIWQKACGLGFVGVHLPEKLGGQGLGYLEDALIIETFCRKDSGIGLALALSDLGAAIISCFGTEAQSRFYIPSICEGEMMPSLVYLENTPLKNPEMFQTTAMKAKDAFILNGHKTFVYNITTPGPMIIMCQVLTDTNSNMTWGFVFKKNLEELKYIESSHRVGMKMIPMGDLTFTDYKISFSSLLHNGCNDPSPWELAINEMNLKASAAGIGIAQGAFDMALAYAHQRKQFGRPIASFDAIQEKLIDMKTRVELSRLLTYKAAWEMDSKGSSTLSAAMAKKTAAETALCVTRDALHIFGGYGYIVDYRIERFYRDASMIDIIGLPCYMHERLLSDAIVGDVALEKT